MIWDLIRGRRRSATGDTHEEIDIWIRKIEKFAPKAHREQRDSRFYNYRMIRPYVKPLLSLLETISQRERLDRDEVEFTRILFLKLKAFYDLRQKLTLAEALDDRNLKIKLLGIFLLFYNREDMTLRDVEGHLAGLREGGL